MTPLNPALDTVVELLLNDRDAEEWDAIVDGEQTERHLEASQKPLALAAVLLQQGTGFSVQAAIAEVSAWMDKAIAQYHPQAEVIGLTSEGGEDLATAQVRGAFPGRPVQFRYRFRLRDDRKAALVIGA